MTLQPIETAPFDTPILLLVDGWKVPQVGIRGKNCAGTVGWVTTIGRDGEEVAVYWCGGDDEDMPAISWAALPAEIAKRTEWT